MSIAQPVRYAPALDPIGGDERETIEKLSETFETILEKTSKDYGHAVRSVHAKAHGLLEGVLEIRPNLPPHLAQGLFAAPGTHLTFMRFSTNAGDVLPDVIALPRGVSIKILDVEGERLAGAEGRTQDFVLVDAPVFNAPSGKKFLAKIKPIAATTDRVEGLKVWVSKIGRMLNDLLEKVIGKKSVTLSTMGGNPNTNPLGQRYFSATPFRYGQYMAKFSLKPRSPDLQTLADMEIDAGHDRDGVRHRVREDMAHTAGEWDFQVQLCRNLEDQPIDDPTVEWDEAKAPFETVATLRVSPQDSWSEEGREKIDERMRFSVWTGLAAHQPLGEVNRMRKDTYKRSSDFRARFNKCPIHEPAE